MRWKSGAGQLHFARTELKSDYPCPVADVAKNFDEKSSQAVWIVQRALRRAQGKPVNSADTETTYPLTCLPQISRNGKPRWATPSSRRYQRRSGRWAATTRTASGCREGSELIRVTGTVDNRKRSFLVGSQQGGWCIPEIR